MRQVSITCYILQELNAFSIYKGEGNRERERNPEMKRHTELEEEKDN